MQNKYWFAYQKGYVNIDHESWVLNTTGVWSECENITEFSKSNPVRTHIANQVYLYILWFVLVSGMLFSGFQTLTNLSQGEAKWLFNLGAMILAGIGTYYIGIYFKRSLGYTGKIYRDKIIALHWKENKLSIQFTDANNQIHNIQLNEVAKEVQEELKIRGYKL